MRAWSAWVLLALLSGPASAEDDAKAKAKARIAAGTRLYNIQQYDQAAAEYEQAYLLDPEPEYLYAIAQAQRLGGDCVKALRSYNAYLRTNPADDSKARANIARCEQDLKDHPPAPDSLTIVPGPVVLPPSAPLPPPPPQAPPRMVSRPWTRDWIGHALVGGGVAIAATGAVLYLDGRSAIADHNAAATYDQFSAMHAAVDAARTRQLIGVTALAAGGGVILGGVLHYVFHTRPFAERTVSATLTPGGASIVVGGAF